MIYSFTYGIYIFLLTLLSGLLLHKGLFNLCEIGEKIEKPSFIRCLIFGLIAVSSFTAAVSFFYPIDVFVHLFFVLVVVAGALIHKNEVLSWLGHYFKRGLQHKYVALFLIIIYIISISEAAGLVSIADTGYYHIPLVKWLNSYGLVKGLANLQDTLGFMSGWFYYASLFDLGMFDDLTYHVLNALAFTWGWGFVAILFIHFREGTYGAKDFLIIPVSIYLGSKIHFIASISPQLIVTLITFWVVYESLSLIGQTSISASRLGNLYLISLYCVFLKVSTAPVLLFLLYPSSHYLSRKFGSEKRLSGQFLRIIIPSSILLGIMLYQNIILTGYPFYPVAAIDIVNVDWKVPEEELRALTKHIKNYGINHQYYDLGIHDFSGFSWLPEWVERNLARRGKTSTILCFTLLPISILVSFLKLIGSRRRSETIPLAFIFFGLLTAVIVWFLTSPNPRFGGVWILPTFFFPLALYLKYNRETVKRYLPGMGIIYVFLLVFWLYSFSGKAQLFSRTLGDNSYLTTWLLDIYTPKYRQIIIANSTRINLPTPTHKGPPIPWDIPLPSVGQELNYKGELDTAIERRGPSLADGFKPSFQTQH